MIRSSGWISVFIVTTGLVFAPSAFGQFRITPGGANAGNGVFRNGPAPTSGTTTGSSTAELRPGDATSTDNMFQLGWWFRGPGDTREFGFANAPAGSPAQTLTIVGNDTGNLDTGGYDHTVTGGAYSFTAQYRWQIVAAALGPTVNYSAVITNTSPSVIDLAMYSYNDFDANGNAAGDTYAINGAGNQFTIGDGPTTITWSAATPSAYQATAFSTLRGLLSNTTVNNLDNTVAGSPGDFTGAFQWSLTLAPNQPQTIAGSFTLAVPEPATFGLIVMLAPLLVRRR